MYIQQAAQRTLENYVTLRRSALETLELSQQKNNESVEALNRTKAKLENVSNQFKERKEKIDMLERKLSQLQLKKITHEDLLEVEFERLNRLKE